MACARNLRKSMFTKLDLIRILSKHHCVIRPDKPVFFSEKRKNTMAAQEEAMDTTLLEHDPADEEAGEDPVGGHEENITEDLVNELLTPAAEPVSMAVSQPRIQPPPEARGLVQATQEVPAADKVTSPTATRSDLERVMAEMARKEKQHQEDMEVMRASLKKLEEGKKLADAKISNLERAEQSRTSRRQKRSWNRTLS